MTDDDAKAIGSKLSLGEQIALLIRMEADGVEKQGTLTTVFEAIRDVDSAESFAITPEINTSEHSPMTDDPDNPPLTDDRTTTGKRRARRPVIEYEDITDEQKRIVDAGNSSTAGVFPEALTRDELLAWMTERFGVRWTTRPPMITTTAILAVASCEGVR